MKLIFALFALFAGTAGAVEMVPVHGSVAIINALPPTATTTATTGNNSAQKYTFLGNTIEGFNEDDDDDTCSPLVDALSLPAGDYLFELFQPPPPPFAAGVHCTAATVFQPSSNSATTGYAQGGCAMARVFLNTKKQDGTGMRRYRLLKGAAIFSFDDRNADCSYNQSFSIRFHIRSDWISANRPTSSYTATLKITKLREPAAEESSE